MMIFRAFVLFAIGGAGYGLIELLWRGRTHWSMIIAGGICFLLFAFIGEWLGEYPLLVKAAAGALGVTAVELIFGVVFNILFGMKVWDYSNMPLNFLGQICPTFSLLWCVLGFIFIPLAELVRDRLEMLIPSI